MSAHSKLLTVNSEGGMPATEEAARKTALGHGGFSQLTQSWLPAQSPYKIQGLAVWVGWKKRKEEGEKRRRLSLVRSFLKETNVGFLMGHFSGSWARKGIPREDCQQMK